MPLTNAWGMRTTLRLDDELLARARVVAKESGRTLSAFVEDSLRLALAKKYPPPRQRIRLPSSGTGGLRPGVTLDNTSGLLDIMDGLD
jgi:hypothetical protein